MAVNLIFSGRTQKENETISDCQDYFQINKKESCFAIADGASQSFYPSIWAELLVNHFCKNPDIDENNWKKWLELIQQKWLQEVKNQVEKAKREHSSIWVTNQNRLNRFESATSTFIGLQFTENKVKVSIVGDSCLFIAREQTQKSSSNNSYSVDSYLLQNSSDFGNRPEYFASYKKNNDFEPHCFDIGLESKKCSENLYFILATDALSEYIFKCMEKKKKIFQTLLEISSPKQFEDFVASARNANTIKMKNDDVTLMVLAVGDRSMVQSKKRERENQFLSIGGGDITLTNETTENNDSVSPSSDEFEQPPAENNPESTLTKLKKQNRNLNLQLLILGVVVVSLLLFIVIDKISSNKENQLANKNNESLSTQPDPNSKVTESKSTPTNLEEEKTTSDKVTKFEPIKKLDKGTTIYKDQELKQVLIEPLLNSHEVIIIEEGEDWIKFQIELYADESLLNLNQCKNCTADEIEIKPNSKLLGFPDPNYTEKIFGQLKDQSRFKKLEFSLYKIWYKFRFEGYIKK